MRKIKLYMLIIACLFLQTVWGQAGAENSVVLSVVVPTIHDELSSGSLSKLESKLQKMATSFGFSGTDGASNFVLYPKFELYEHRVIEGMRQLHQVEVEVSIFVQEITTKVVYASYTQEIKAEGYSKPKAILRAIKELRTSGSRLDDFFNKVHIKVADYYEKRCSMMLTQASQLSERKQYDEAISILSQIPMEASSCFEKAQNDLVAVYYLRQDRLCSQNLLKAQAEIARNNFNAAADYLKFIDPEAKCAPDAQRLIVQLEGRVDEERKEQIELFKYVFEGKIELEKYRAGLISDMTRAYLASRPRVQYVDLF